MSVVALPPPTSAVEENKTASTSVTSAPNLKDPPLPDFKLLRVKKPDGTIVIVKRKVKAAPAEVPADTPATVHVASEDKPTKTTEVASSTVESPPAASVEAIQIPETNDESQDAGVLATKLDKRKFSVPWLGKKEKATVIIDELAEVPKSTFAKLRATIRKPTNRVNKVEPALDHTQPTTDSTTIDPAIAVEAITATASISQHQMPASDNAAQGKLEEETASVHLAMAANLSTHGAHSALHNIEHEVEMLHHTMSNNVSSTTRRPSQYQNNNNDYDQTNAAVYSGATTNAGLYDDDWRSDDEEVNPTSYSTGNQTQNLYSGASGALAGGSLAQTNSNDDDIEDFNPDTDIPLEDEGEDDIEEYNPETDEFFEEDMFVGGDEGYEGDGPGDNGGAFNGNDTDTDNYDDSD